MVIYGNISVETSSNVRGDPVTNSGWCVNIQEESNGDSDDSDGDDTQQDRYAIIDAKVHYYVSNLLSSLHNYCLQNNASSKPQYNDNHNRNNIAFNVQIDFNCDDNDNSSSGISMSKIHQICQNRFKHNFQFAHVTRFVKENPEYGLSAVVGILCNKQRFCDISDQYHGSNSVVSGKNSSRCEFDESMIKEGLLQLRFLQNIINDSKSGSKNPVLKLINCLLKSFNLNGLIHTRFFHCYLPPLHQYDGFGSKDLCVSLWYYSFDSKGNNISINVSQLNHVEAVMSYTLDYRQSQQAVSYHSNNNDDNNDDVHDNDNGNDNNQHDSHTHSQSDPIMESLIPPLVERSRVVDDEKERIISARHGSDVNTTLQRGDSDAKIGSNYIMSDPAIAQRTNTTPATRITVSYYSSSGSGIGVVVVLLTV